MTNFPGQPQNVAITVGVDEETGAALDVSVSNPIPVTGTVSVAGAAASLGQKAMAESSPVVIASDQAVFPVGVTSTVKGTSAATNITSTPNGVNHQGLDVVEQFAPTYEDNSAGRALVEQRNGYANINSATTTVVKGAPGFLHLISINKAVASATITIYDNTSAAGTIIGVITMPAVLLASQAMIRLDVSFATGLTLVTVGAQDLTVSFR